MEQTWLEQYPRVDVAVASVFAIPSVGQPEAERLLTKAIGDQSPTSHPI